MNVNHKRILKTADRDSTERCMVLLSELYSRCGYPSNYRLEGDMFTHGYLYLDGVLIQKGSYHNITQYILQLFMENTLLDNEAEDYWRILDYFPIYFDNPELITYLYIVRIIYHISETENTVISHELINRILKIGITGFNNPVIKEKADNYVKILWARHKRV